MMPARRWTPERDAALLALYARTGPERLLCGEIARLLGASFWAVRHRLSRLGARRTDWTAGRGFAMCQGPKPGDRVLDDDPDAQPTGRVTHTLHKVRCLGQGEPHMFWSRDPRAHRVCDRCQRLGEQGVSDAPTLHEDWADLARRVRREYTNGQDR
ncbi:hypothetical protein M0638_27430 [Roseomonas sp. NAR14]|uniref:Uncharacterized protein n=1 Tax=Roseomonas acroporae TaxID=2937791 RepID=A0A9X1YFT2_9PROT|nr:hypothetical protein [Roseomonas acroporae]MCK8788093.1 hypothetical protein [Roseomonas acroporae]